MSVIGLDSCFKPNTFMNVVALMFDIEITTFECETSNKYLIKCEEICSVSMSFRD